jgi:predicted transcriptional regulator
MNRTHEMTTMEVYDYLLGHPGASLEEIATALDISSRSNVRYHLIKLADKGLVNLGGRKHRSFRAIERIDQ